ncbi:MAG: hypothetical protein ACK4HV_00935, partial [Parachlamydiaceae bacterium]
MRFAKVIDLKNAPLTEQKTYDLFMNFLDSSDCIAVQDDWQAWSKDNEMSRSGKPFIFDSEGVMKKKTLSLFFDDKMTGEEKDIIRPIDLSGRAVPTKDLKGRQLFAVNTTKAALDETYYIRKVLKALARLA